MRTIKGNPNNKDWLRYWLNIGQKLLRQKGAIALPPPQGQGQGYDGKTLSQVFS